MTKPDYEEQRPALISDLMEMFADGHTNRLTYRAAGDIARLAEERDALLSKLRQLLEAVRKAEEVFALAEHPARFDPLYGAEVEALGARIGYGALMSSAQASWRQSLATKGYPVGGEHVAGPCYATVTHTLAILRAALEQAGEQGSARSKSSVFSNEHPDAVNTGKEGG